MQTLPPSFLVQPTFPVQQLTQWPKKLTMSLYDRISPIAPMKQLDSPSVAMNLRIGWHAKGLIIGVDVVGKSKPATTYSSSPSDSDSVAFFFDFRNTKSIRRGSRFCHCFRVVPFDGDGQASPLVVQEPVPRAREDSPFHDLISDAVTKKTKEGYRTVARLPAENLTGYDPSEVSQIGFFALLRDNELGDEPLTGDLLLPTATDPSMWSTISLS